MAKTGIELITEERVRQIEKEGFTPEHDHHHDEGSIALAAVAYASPLPVRVFGTVDDGSVFGKKQWIDPWPWDSQFDKRGKHDRLRSLVIAGALIAAEIDRLQRESKGAAVSA